MPAELNAPVDACSIAGPNGTRIPTDEPHAWVSRKGPDNVWVRTCQLCPAIDWDDLREGMLMVAAATFKETAGNLNVEPDVQGNENPAASTTPASMGEPLSEAELAAFAESAPERIDCELWTLLDWSLWAAGMGDTFREPLASTMVAAVPERARAQAELLMQEWLRIRNVESPSKTNAGLRAKLAEAEQARDEAIRVAGANAVAYDETRAEAAELRARVGVLEGQLATAQGLVADLVDDGHCRFDHHGYCQDHGWFETEPACPHGRAKALGLDGGGSDA